MAYVPVSRSEGWSPSISSRCSCVHLLLSLKDHDSNGRGSDIFSIRKLWETLADPSIETVDQRLLLAIQWACNKQGVKIPYALAATKVGPFVTEGAIVQHLAKLRIRLKEKNEEVPPVLKRGGGNGADAVSSKASKNTKAKEKAKDLAKVVSKDTDSEDEDGSSDDDYDTQKASGGGKSKARAKGKKVQLKSRSRKTTGIKRESSEEIRTSLSGKARGKRPRPVSDDESDYEQQKKSAKISDGHNSAARRTQSSLDYDDDDADNDFGDWEEPESDDEGDHDVDVTRKTVAAGAPFLEQESDVENEDISHESDMQSHIVKLPIGHGFEAKQLLRELGYGSDGYEGSQAGTELAPTEKAANQHGQWHALDGKAGFEDTLPTTTPGANFNDSGSSSFSVSATQANNFGHGFGALTHQDHSNPFATSTDGFSLPSSHGQVGSGGFMAVVPSSTRMSDIGVAYHTSGGLGGAGFQTAGSNVPLGAQGFYGAHGYGQYGFQNGQASFGAGFSANASQAGSADPYQPQTQNIERARHTHHTTHDDHDFPEFLAHQHTGAAGLDDYGVGDNGYYDFHSGFHAGDSVYGHGLPEANDFMEDIDWDATLGTGMP